MKEHAGTVFVKIEEYKDVLDIMNVIKTKLNEANKIIYKIHELKVEEDSELEAWRNELADVERKVDFIDNMLFEPEG